MYEPLVTVVIPLFNQALFIEANLTSVKNQSYRNIQVIIIDDGSEDSSFDIANRFVKTDARFQIIRTQNRGVSSARNLGISLAQGEFVAFLDSDDLWLPNKLELQMRILGANRNLGALVSNYFVAIKGEGGVIVAKRLVKIRAPHRLAYGWLSFEGSGPLLSSSLLIRTECLKLNSDKIIFDINLSTLADLDFFLRINQITEVGIVQEPLVYYLQHDKQMHSDPEFLLREYPKLLSKLNDSRIYNVGPRLHANLYVFASLLYAKQGKFVVAMRCVSRSFSYSFTSIFYIPIRVLFKRVVGYVDLFLFKSSRAQQSSQ